MIKDKEMQIEWVHITCYRKSDTSRELKGVHIYSPASLRDAIEAAHEAFKAQGVDYDEICIKKIKLPTRD